MDTTSIVRVSILFVKKKIMNETNINKINSRLEALEKLCNNQHSELFKNKLGDKTVEVKVNISALYSYFDLLAGDEVNLKGSTNIPVYVKQQLRNIHELFEGVLDLSLEEVKTLYFKRNMSKQESKVTKTKKVKELVVGDKIILPDVSGVHTITQIQFTEYGIFQLNNGTGNNIYPSDTNVTIVNE